MTVQLLHGDCLDVLATLPDASVDAVVTDPPYGLEFMGKEWDAPWKSAGAVIHDPATERGGFQDGNGGNPYSRSRIEYGRGGDASVGFQQWCEAWAAECLRVLKPGGHLLAFGGMRTQHRLACGIEDAGFEIRDSLAYMYGSGFPKSLNVTKALDRIVSADARCVCAPHSTRTVPDSQADCLSSHGSDGGRPQSGAGSDRGPAPSPDDAHARTHDGLPQDARAEELASTSPGAGSDHPSIGRSAHDGSRPEWSRVDALAESGTRTSRSSAPEQEPRRTHDRTRYMSDSAFDSVSAPHQYMACPACGGARIPQGLGTALKPAMEIIVLARKPLAGSVAATVQAHGTGALNIDSCRIAGDEDGSRNRPPSRLGSSTTYAQDEWTRTAIVKRQDTTGVGRWPTNVVLDETAAAMLDDQSGDRPSSGGAAFEVGGYGGSVGLNRDDRRGDSGGASRFFYTAKADQRERPRVPRRALRLRSDLTPEQVDRVMERLREAGVADV